MKRAASPRVCAAHALAGGRANRGLRTEEEDVAEEEAPVLLGAQKEGEGGSNDEEGSEAGGVEGAEVDRDEEDVQYPPVDNELDNYRKGVRDLAHLVHTNTHF